MAMFVTLRRRSEFLRVRGGARWATAVFVLEAKQRIGAEAANEARFGFTVTKKLGNAVVRNRIRRRLREAVRLMAHGTARPDYDYVLIARGPALDREFTELKRDLENAFSRVHRPARGKSREPAT
jgi:ribonuclease P protein component